MTIAAGTKPGRYQITSQLGAGGMGEVYLAEDTKLDRKVALKILPADVASKQERMTRFVSEAKTAAGRKRLPARTSDYIFRHDWSDDGKWLTLARGRVMTDVVLMRDNRER